MNMEVFVVDFRNEPVQGIAFFADMEIEQHPIECFG